MTPAQKTETVSSICLTLAWLCVLLSLYLMFTHRIALVGLTAPPAMLIAQFGKRFSKRQKAKQKEDEEAPKMTAR